MAYLISIQFNITSDSSRLIVQCDMTSINKFSGSKCRCYSCVNSHPEHTLNAHDTSTSYPTKQIDAIESEATDHSLVTLGPPSHEPTQVAKKYPVLFKSS